MDETKLKQTILRSEILDKGYDSEIFTEFMNSRKIEGKFY